MSASFQALEASGVVYSLISDRWTRLPVKPENKIDQTKIFTQAKHYASRFDKLNQDFKNSPKGMLCNLFLHLNRELSKFRGRGFKTAGEYSIKNLAYKALRNG